jgi:hypothetical protein
MRSVWVAVLVAGVAGCGTDYYVDLSPRFDRPVGLDLTVDVSAAVVACRMEGFDEEMCNNHQTTGLEVELDGATLVLGPPTSTYSDFTLTGVAVGTSTLSIDGEDAGIDVEIAVHPVASSDLYIERWGGVTALPNERGTVAAFTGASLLLNQAHEDAAGTFLLGHSPWSLAAGTTGTVLAEYDELVVGPSTGRATVSTAVGGEIAFDVVDGSAIDALEVHQTFADEPIDEVELPVGVRGSVYLRAYDATGRTIVGLGPRPTWNVAPLIATLDVEEDYGDTREIVIETIEPGTAVAEIAWGPRTFELTIVIR